MTQQRRLIAILGRALLVFALAELGPRIEGSTMGADLSRLLVITALLLVVGDALLRASGVAFMTAEVVPLAAVAGGAVLYYGTVVAYLLSPDSARSLIVMFVVAAATIFAAWGTRTTCRFRPSGRLDWLAVAGASLISVFFIGAVRQTPFFLGYDPFAMASYAQRIIADGVSPFAFPEASFNHAGQYAGGAYFLTAGVSLISGQSIGGIVHVGGIVVSAAIAVLLALVVLRGFGSHCGGFLAALLFVSGSFMMGRLVMFIRENIGLVFFLALLLLILVHAQQASLGAIGLAALVTGVGLQSHEAIGILSLMVWIIYVGKAMVDRRGERLSRTDVVTACGLIGLFSLPFAIPVVGQFIPLFLGTQIEGVSGRLDLGDPALSIWRRGIRFSDLPMLGVVLSPLGIGSIRKARRCGAAALILLPPSLLVAGVLPLARLGAPLPIVRLIPYVSLIVAVLGGLGAAWIARSLWSNRYRATMVLLIGAFVVSSLFNMGQYRKGTPFSQSQVYAAQRTAEMVNITRSPILAPFNEVSLLLFVGIDSVVTDFRSVAAILTAPTFEEMMQELDELGLQRGPVWVFISKKFARDGINVSPDTRSGLDKPITIFSFLREVSPTLTLGAEPGQRRSSSLCVQEYDLGAAWLYRIERCVEAA